MNGVHKPSGTFRSKLLRGMQPLMDGIRYRRGKIFLWALLLLVTVQLVWQAATITIKRYYFVLSLSPAKEPQPGVVQTDPPVTNASGPGWVAALELLHSASRRYIVINVKNGLGNRLRALASGMAVAASLNRPVLLIWVPDLHCNCSFRRMFSRPLHFILLEEEIPPQNLSSSIFQVYNYMRPEPGAIKDEKVNPDPQRHLYFKSGFLMNHPRGKWTDAQRQLQRLVPAKEVLSRVVASKEEIGLHIRNVFDAPRDAATNKSTVGAAAVLGAQKEYGVDGTQQLLKWRRASHWTNFVPRIISLLREHSFRPGSGQQAPLRFYLAADSEDAYAGLVKRFPNRMMFTRRHCAAERCDFRDCEGMLFSMIDMINLARTRLILGSGWSSYSEVAAYWGGSRGQPVPMLMAGKDFGMIVDQKRLQRGGSTSACCSSQESESKLRDRDMALNLGLQVVDEDQRTHLVPIQQFWQKPF